MNRYRDVIGMRRGDAASVSVRARTSGGRLRVEVLDTLPETDADRPNRVCAMTLPGEQVFLRVLSADASTPGVRPREAMAEQIASFDESGEVETVRARTRAQRMGSRHTILFAMARSEVVADAFRHAEAHALELVDLVPAPLALYNAAYAVTRIRGPLLCLRIGVDATDVFLGRGRVPLLARRLSVGSRALDGDASGGDAWAAWERELKTALDHVQSLWPATDARPLKTVVCRDRACPEPELDRIRGIVSGPCLDAASLLPGAQRPVEQGGALFLAMGCALTSLGRAVIPLSIFPEAAREKQGLQRQLPWWIAAAVFAVAGLLLPAFQLRQERGVYRRQAHRYQARLDRLSGLERDLLALQASNQALHRGIAPLRSAVHGADAVRRVLQAVASAKHENDWIILAADADRYQAEGRVAGGRGTGRPTAGAPLEYLIVEGYTPAHDLSSVRAMIERLRLYPFIAEADLLADDRLRQDSARDRLWAPLGCRLFALEIRIVIP